MRPTTRFERETLPADEKNFVDRIEEGVYPGARVGIAARVVDYRARFRGTPSSVREARQAILDYAKACGFDARELVDVALGAGEALANAVEHGNKDLGFITVSCRFENGVLAIEVADAGLGFDTTNVATKLRDPSAVRGFGISIMHAVMDQVDYLDRGTTVRLLKRRAVDAEDGLDVEPERETQA